VTSRTRKLLFAALLILSFFLLLPLSDQLVDSRFTIPFNPNLPKCVLLVWSDHIEARWVDSISEVSPRPSNADYSFLVPAGREGWVRQQLRSQPLPGDSAGWLLKVRQIAPDRQKIQLEVMGDGYTGLIYEATRDRVVPLRSRLAGPGGVFLFLEFQLVLWGSCWFVIRITWFLMKKHRARREAHLGN
jgi:hypothetical protein